MRRFFFPLSVSVVAFCLGVFLANFLLSSQIGESPTTAPTIATDSLAQPDTEPLAKPDNSDFHMPVDNCEEVSETGNYEAMLGAWLRGIRFAEGTPYCSGTTKEATSFNGTNIHPSYVDLNSDGTDEFTIRTNCGATGNCDMDIFERVGNRPRRILRAVHGVQLFGKQGEKYFGYYDVWTRMHGSWNAGDQVVYRYNGRRYRPIACYAYEYEDGDTNGKATEEPTLTPYPCRRNY